MLLLDDRDDEAEEDDWNLKNKVDVDWNRTYQN